MLAKSGERMLHLRNRHSLSGGSHVPLTVFLARFIGLFTVLLVAAFLIRGSTTIETAISDGQVMLVYAIISLATGLAMILGHNVWSGGVLAVVVNSSTWSERIVVSINEVPDLTLNLPSGARSTVKVQPSHIRRVSEASERRGSGLRSHRCDN